MTAPDKSLGLSAEEIAGLVKRLRAQGLRAAMGPDPDCIEAADALVALQRRAETAEEAAQYADGVADLAMRRLNNAEVRADRLAAERDRLRAQTIAECIAAIEREALPGSWQGGSPEHGVHAAIDALKALALPAPEEERR